MKKYIFILLSAFMAFTFTSCDEEAVPVPPTFKGFKVNPKPCMPGDTVRVQLYFADKGKNVYLPQPQNTYWTMTIDTLATDGTTHTVTLSSSEGGSIGHEFLKKDFILPKTTKPGTKTCRVKVNFTCSADSKEPIIRKNTLMPGFEGTLEDSKIRSILYGEFNGSVDIQIVEP